MNIWCVAIRRPGTSMGAIRWAAMSRPLRSSRTDKQGHVPQPGIVDNGVFLNVLIIIAVQDAMKRRLKAEGSLRQCSGNDRNRIEPDGRSEEHTSELQSLMRISYAVFCLKKKKQ